MPSPSCCRDPPDSTTPHLPRCRTCCRRPPDLRRRPQTRNPIRARQVPASGRSRAARTRGPPLVGTGGVLGSACFNLRCPPLAGTAGVDLLQPAPQPSSDLDGRPELFRWTTPDAAPCSSYFEDAAQHLYLHNALSALSALLFVPVSVLLLDCN